MIVSFEDQDYKFDFNEVDVREAIYVQNQTAMTLGDLQDKFLAGDGTALLALYWLMLKQNGKTADMSKVNFKALAFRRALVDAIVADNEANPTEEQDEAATTTTAE